MVAEKEVAASSLGPSRESRLSDELLAIVRSLAVELHPHLERTIVVRLDSDLDRDLGLDSLARSELMLRLDRAFKVKLPDQILGDATTPADLLQAVKAARPLGVAVAYLTTAAPPALPAVAEPIQAETLLEAFDYHVRLRGERPHVILWRGEEPEETITYAALDTSARRVARSLFARGHEAGDRVAIMLPTEAGFFQAFFGVLIAGGVPVPIYPPFRRGADRGPPAPASRHPAQCRCPRSSPSEEIRPFGAAALRPRRAPAAGARRSASFSPADPVRSPRRPHARRRRSFSIPRAAPATQRGSCCRMAICSPISAPWARRSRRAHRDVFVSWLPLYHDMGLIGAWLGCLYYGAPTVIMPPLAFSPIRHAGSGRSIDTARRSRPPPTSPSSFA